MFIYLFFNTTRSQTCFFSPLHNQITETRQQQDLLHSPCGSSYDSTRSRRHCGLDLSRNCGTGTLSIFIRNIRPRQNGFVTYAPERRETLAKAFRFSLQTKRIEKCLCCLTVEADLARLKTSPYPLTAPRYRRGRRLTTRDSAVATVQFSGRSVVKRPCG